MQTNYSPSSEINHLLLEPFCLLFNAGIGNRQSEVYKQSFFDSLVLVCEKNRNQMGNNNKIQWLSLILAKTTPLLTDFNILGAAVLENGFAILCFQKQAEIRLVASRQYICIWLSTFL